MKRRFLSIIFTIIVVFSLSLSAFAHSGRTDSSGGHKDNKNKSGLGSYHYHCGGYPAHLHSGGVCPYRSTKTSYSAPKTVYSTKITVPNMPKSIDAGEDIKLNGSVYPSTAEDKTISWSSSDKSVATVDSSGNLNAVGVGNVVITAKTSRGTTAKFNLLVNEVIAECINIKEKVEKLTIEDTLGLSVVFTPENTTYKEIEWKSDDESIASVDRNGLVTALGVGKTTITATHKDLTDSFELEIMPILAESIELELISSEDVDQVSSSVAKIKSGTEIKLKATIAPSNTTDKTIKWKSSDESIATVDQDGTVRGISGGTVIITAETENGLLDEYEIEISKNQPLIVYFITIILMFGIVFAIITIITKLKNKHR